MCIATFKNIFCGLCAFQDVSTQFHLSDPHSHKEMSIKENWDNSSPSIDSRWISLSALFDPKLNQILYLKP